MTRALQFVAIAALMIMTAIACTPPANEQAAPAAAPASAAPSPGDAADITLKTDPTPARRGDNTFEAVVMQDGKPVEDAVVSVEIFMAAMPAMRMAEMKTTAELKPAGNGVYRGTGQVMMAGNWDVTVKAMRNGQEIASRKVTVAAK